MSNLSGCKKEIGGGDAAWHKMIETMDVLAGLAKDFFSENFTAMTQRYASLSPPLEIVWGEKDKFLPPEFGRRLSAAVSGSRLHMLKKAGHSPHQERPETFNRLLVDALRAT
jgi:pimeloyl-ACP methyl ester carboxylesterase